MRDFVEIEQGLQALKLPYKNLTRLYLSGNSEEVLVRDIEKGDWPGALAASQTHLPFVGPAS